MLMRPYLNVGNVMQQTQQRCGDEEVKADVISAELLATLVNAVALLFHTSLASITTDLFKHHVAHISRLDGHVHRLKRPKPRTVYLQLVLALILASIDGPATCNGRPDQLSRTRLTTPTAHLTQRTSQRDYPLHPRSFRRPQRLGPSNTPSPHLSPPTP